MFSDVWESWLVGPVVFDVYQYFLARGATEYSMLSRNELQELTKDKAYQLARDTDNLISSSRIVLNIEK